MKFVSLGRSISCACRALPVWGEEEAEGSEPRGMSPWMKFQVTKTAVCEQQRNDGPSVKNIII